MKVVLFESSNIYGVNKEEEEEEDLKGRSWKTKKICEGIRIRTYIGYGLLLFELCCTIKI
jgi:hypothetical protein